MTRDYAAEMLKIIDEAIDGEPYKSRIVAAKVVETLRATDPDLLHGWLDAQAEDFIWNLINTRDRSGRAHVKATSGAKVFGEMTERTAETGNTGELTGFLAERWTTADNLRKPLGLFDQADLTGTADRYATLAARNKMNEIFLRKIAEKVGDDLVKDHFTSEQLTDMWRSLGNK